MARFSAKFEVSNGFKLADCDPRDTGGFADKESTKLETEKDAQAINTLQDALFAEGSRALLVVLQGMDCSGKDGTVRGVFNSSGPLGVHVTSFRAPNEEERGHDYLWRVHKACPSFGIIGVFNRSHYEDVLVVKVRNFAKPDAIERRYGEINDFERMLTNNGTRILKFMLNISLEEQAERLKDRLQDPNKHWKFNPSDLEDRKLWPKFMEAYETALKRCSTDYAPWHVIPADRKWVRNAVIARIVRETLEEMDPKPRKANGFDPKEMLKLLG